MKNRLFKLLADGKTAEVIDILEKENLGSDKELQYALWEIQTRLNALKRKKQLSLLTQEEEVLRINQINQALLGIIEGYEGQKKTTTPVTSIVLGIAGLIIALLIGVVQFTGYNFRNIFDSKKTPPLDADSTYTVSIQQSTNGAQSPAVIADDIIIVYGGDWEKEAENSTSSSIVKVPRKSIEGKITYEEIIWEGAKRENTLKFYKAYISAYPTGKYLTQAWEKIEEITNEHFEKSIKNIKGRLVYQIPDTMIFNQEYRIGMEVSGDTSLISLKNMINSYSEFKDNLTDVNSEIIRVGKRMRAILIDPSPEPGKKFRIQAFGESNERLISMESSEPALWEWHVVPIRQGKHKLYFSIEIVTVSEIGNPIEVIPVKEAEVLVMVEESLFQKYYGIGILVMVIVLGSLFLFFKRKKKLIETYENLPIDKTREMVGDGRVSEALIKLQNSFKEKRGKIYKGLIHLKNRFENFEQKSIKGIMSNDELTRENNKITDDFLSLLDEVEDAIKKTRK